ncbi:MAG: hypothetical protein IJW27_06755 [Clostridia bacterium]|nr:hypothetical protein [Clostridia bacterium]
MSGGHLCKAEAPTEATAETSAPPDENETKINGYSQYIIYADSFLRNSVTPSVACGATFPYHRGRLRFIVAVFLL